MMMMTFNPVLTDDGFVDPRWFAEHLWNKYFLPPRRITVSEWADENRELNSKSSAEHGMWQTDRTPYLREIMDCFSESSYVSEVVFIKPVQIGGSEAGINLIGYVISESPGPMMVVLPNNQMCKRYMIQRVDPMIMSAECLRSRIAIARGRTGSNSISEKDFPGGILISTTANSAAGLRSAPIRYLILEEVDAWPQDVQNEGSPIELAKKRQDTFYNRKTFINSTPVDEESSLVWPEFLTSDQRQYYVPCPYCGYEQILEWGDETTAYGIKWEKDHPETARYHCSGCGEKIEEHHKRQMLSKGKWIAKYPERTKRGYWINSLYSPLGWVSWADIVKEYLEAKKESENGNFIKLKTWTNTRLAKVWKNQAQNIADDSLKARAEPYALQIVPERALILTAGIDTQDDRWEVAVYGWGRGEESWVVDYQVLMGDPSNPEDWEKLDAYLMTRFHHERGIDMGISAAAIDTGGHFTHNVYNWVRTRPSHRRIYAIQGSNQAKCPIKGKSSLKDVNSRDGRVIPQGVRLWQAGVTVAKDVLFKRLEKTGSQPGAIHFSKDLEDKFYVGLTSERKIQVITSKGMKLQWKAIPGRRREVLDTTVYAMFAATMLDVNRYTPAMWDAIEEKLFPRQKSLLESGDGGIVMDHEIPSRQYPSNALRKRSKWGRR